MQIKLIPISESIRRTEAKLASANWYEREYLEHRLAWLKMQKAPCFEAIAPGEAQG